ncbi:hypothetical protein [Streptomyces qinglanensis]|uniref:Uncharacterized protein n=1 Tax=Streptomyces qinglanensis TaxID=943816 RepID=A0A1H9WQ99_9ACTN|nr:hypothetical protein [Streptomyces qinglanensis]SES35583.1 hypothetical protein SAMN05421870_11946 [Streptomyces qinglanensis]
MDKSDKQSISSRGAPEQEESKSGKRLELSLAQVLGSAVAAVVAAFAAGQLGVYGTFLGAGVMSLVATSGGPVFQHFFSRTGEQIKEVTVPPKARQLPVRDPAAGWKDDEGGHTGQAVHNADVLHGSGPVTTSWGQGAGSGAGPDGTDATRALRRDDLTGALRSEAEAVPLRDADATQVLGTADATRVLRSRHPARSPQPADATRALEGADRSASARDGAAAAGEVPGDGEFTSATTHGTTWRGWRRTLLPAVLVFVIAIGGITLYEALSGHNVSGGKGTSLSDVFRPGHDSSTGDSPDAPPASPGPDGSEDGQRPTTDPSGSGQSADPGDRNGDRSGRNDSGDSGDTGGGATPTPEPSPSQPDGTDDGGDSGSGDTGTGDSGSDSGQDGGAGTDQGETGGSGSGADPPQGQQPG